jgi:hypothetical protein
MSSMGRCGWVLSLAAAAALLAGCGGSVDGDGSGNGGSATGGVAGKGGGAFGGSAGVAGGGGVAGYGGAAPYCCTSTADCPEYFGNDAQGSQCIAGVCKPNPPTGTCWTDLDCFGVPGSCMGASVCPCGADCFGPDQLGKCNVLAGCCATSADCPLAEQVCVSGNCEKPPPPGQCWTDQDCFGSTCNGACICPCGTLCACGGQMGWCEDQTPPPPACCTNDMACGDEQYVPCVNGVCKQPIAGYCWKDAECSAGQKCVGVFVCPCGAACGQAETPGKCQ